MLLPPVLLVLLATGLGTYLGWRVLKHERNRPVLIAVHLLPGIGALELIALLLRGAPNGATLATTTPGKLAALMIVVTLLIGFLSPIVLRGRSRGAVLTALSLHAIAGYAALGLLLAWLLSA